jgi:SNF2 family DNA or RNA helicase
MLQPLELFEFQKYSVDYFIDKRSVLLGDQMGLGKTLQAVELDRRRRIKQPNITKNPKTLVVTYLGIFSSWEKEFIRQTDLRITTLNPKNRKHFIYDMYADEADVFVMHWQAVRLMPELQEIKWYHIIADECHALQNRKSKQTLAFKELNSFYKTGLSGTPAFDKPDDLWSILHWLYPNYWQSYWKYYNEHVMYVDEDGYRVVCGVRNVEKLQEEMRGFYIRRRKEDVLQDLPEKYRSERVVDLDPKQKRIYDQMKKDMLAYIGEHEDEAVPAPAIVAQLTRLQQFSDAYGEAEMIRKRKKIKVTSENMYELIQQGAIKADENGNYPEFIFKEVDILQVRLTEPSSKLDAVMEIIRSTPQQIVVFSQFSQVIRLLAKRLEKEGIPSGIFIGATPPDERARIIEQFQGGGLQVFAGTIAAGGVGITLTASSTVVFIDRSWSASLNEQAEDRCHRIGQKNAVHIIDIISRGTIDAKRIQKINLKWSWIRKLIGDDVDIEDGNDEINYDYDDEDWDEY